MNKGLSELLNQLPIINHFVDTPDEVMLDQFKQAALDKHQRAVTPEWKMYGLPDPDAVQKGLNSFQQARDQYQNQYGDIASNRNAFEQAKKSWMEKYSSQNVSKQDAENNIESMAAADSGVAPKDSNTTSVMEPEPQPAPGAFVGPLPQQPSLSPELAQQQAKLQDWQNQTKEDPRLTLGENVSRGLVGYRAAKAAALAPMAFWDPQLKQITTEYGPGRIPLTGQEAANIDSRQSIAGARHTPDEPIVIDDTWHRVVPQFPVGTKTTYGAVQMAAQQNSRAIQPYAQTRSTQYLIQDMPSSMSPTSVSGAASQVLFAANQGKALISKPGSAQKMNLVSSEIARVVQRSAPQLATLEGADYSNNILTKVSKIQQQLTANPNGPDAPLLRQELYNTLEDLAKAAVPYVQRQLDNVEDARGMADPNFAQDPKWQAMRKREMDRGLYDEPFASGTGQTNPQQPAPDANNPQTKPAPANIQKYVAEIRQKGFRKASEMLTYLKQNYKMDDATANAVVDRVIGK